MATKAWTAIDDAALHREYLRWEARRRREENMPELNRDGRPVAILWLEAALVAAGFLALLWLWMW